MSGTVTDNQQTEKENKKCKCQHKCSKKKTEKTKVKIYVIETDHGPINLTKARFHDNCLGKYIEAAIANKGLNGALKVATWTDCDDGSGTWISLESPEFLNEKGEICFECIENESNRRDEQKILAFQQTKEMQKWKITLLKQIIGKKNLTNARTRGKYIEAAINSKGWNRALKVGTSSDCEDYIGSCISWDFHMNSNEKGDICLKKCIKNESNREDEQSWWLKPQQTKDSWEEWDSDEESSISSELEQFKIGETNARSNCLSNSLTNQLLANHDETETLVPCNVDGIIETRTLNFENQLSSVEDSAESSVKSS